MKLRAVWFCMLVSFPLLLNAQDTSGERTKPPAPALTITTIPIRLLRDINLGVGFRLDHKHSLEVRAGYVIPNKLLGYLDQWVNHPEMKFQGPSVYVSRITWRINPKGKFRFWAVTVGYRYLYFLDDTFWPEGHSGGTSSADNVRLSQWRNDVILLASVGGANRFSSIEFALGPRISWIHTHQIDTRIHPPNMTPEEYDAYKQSVFGHINELEGLVGAVVVRVTWKVGCFRW